MKFLNIIKQSSIAILLFWPHFHVLSIHDAFTPDPNSNPIENQENLVQLNDDDDNGNDRISELLDRISDLEKIIEVANEQRESDLKSFLIKESTLQDELRRAQQISTQNEEYYEGFFKDKAKDEIFQEKNNLLLEIDSLKSQIKKLSIESISLEEKLKEAYKKLESKEDDIQRLKRMIETNTKTQDLIREIRILRAENCALKCKLYDNNF